MMQRLFLSVAAAAAVLLASPPSAARESGEPASIMRDLVYRQADGTALHLDLYLHAGARRTPVPVLLYFHGGGWARGARPAGWQAFRPYLDAGFSVAAVQYRLAGEARAPAAVIDARCALHWAGANAARFGFDPDRILLAGSSAGAHLALMAGLLPASNAIDAAECRNPPRAAAVIDFYGPTDLAVLRSGGGGLHPTVANWIGARDDAAEMARAMSPLTWLDAASPPIFIVHGDADKVVPIAQSQILKRRLDALGIRSDFVVVAGGGHGKFDAAARAAMMARLVAWLCAAKIPSSGACSDAD
ncbi:MAG: alpha/beta hydrolase fold domain-containing protein [Sphingopyxis sp.]